MIISAMMVSWLFTNFMLLLPTLFPSIQLTAISETIWVVDVIAVLNVVGSAFVVSLFILFVDSFEGQISAIKTSVAVGLTLVAVFLAVAGLGKLFVPSLNSDVTLTATILGVNDFGSCDIGSVDCLTTMRWSPIPSLILFPVLVITFIWSNQELSQSKKFSFSSIQTKQINLMRLGTIFSFFIGPIFGILGVILVDFSNEPVLGTYASEIFGYLIVSFGVFLIGLSYISSKRVAFLLPQRVDALLTINNAGLPLYQYEFREKAIEGEPTLVSGAITAITALMKEAFGVTGDVEKIEFQDRQLLLRFEKDTAFILITQRSSTFLKSALERFSKTFLLTFEEELNFVGNIEVFKQIEPDLLNIFGLESTKNNEIDKII